MLTYFQIDFLQVYSAKVGEDKSWGSQSFSSLISQGISAFH